MYSENFVVAIKCDGKILREDGDSVFIPFGKQFTVLLKNLNTLSAQVRLEIDGELVASNVLIHGNSSVELDSYQVGNNKGRRLKFIKTNDQIADYRGLRVDDGLLRVEFDFAKVQPQQQFISTIFPQIQTWPKKPVDIWRQTDNSQNFFNRDARIGSTQNGGQNNMALGITVPGDESIQEPVNTNMLDVQGTPKAMVLRMVGEINAKYIEKPKLVIERKKCPVCGTVNKNAKFCRSCGTGIW